MSNLLLIRSTNDFTIKCIFNVELMRLHVWEQTQFWFFKNTLTSTSLWCFVLMITYMLTVWLLTYFFYIWFNCIFEVKFSFSLMSQKIYNYLIMLKNKQNLIHLDDINSKKSFSSVMKIEWFSHKFLNLNGWFFYGENNPRTIFKKC